MAALVGILGLQIGEEVAPNQATLILPNFGPPRAPLDKVSSMLGKAMPVGRFHTPSRQLLLSMQVEEDVTAYRPSRLLATVADLLQYPAPDRSR